ncbi:hypothetical protein QYM36_016220 [Artemia franciscana]|uniref:PiggyBac transposable element-derived protein domain-containing protein n=1 Tax=Artemia franciscana TaxID=6661 RepID=A0AA88H6K3_ARTSF|nr:hypothetical protein QYM36_016220 [Artemia franciscana]
MYWEAAVRYSQIADKMGQQRFDKIKCFLCFNGNSKAKKPGEHGLEKLYKIRSVLSHIRYMFLEVRKGTLVEDDIEPNLGVGGNIVLCLMSILPEKMNYKIYFENWFSRLKLMSLLKIQGFPCIGTLNKAQLKGCPLLTDGEMEKRERGASG